MYVLVMYKMCITDMIPEDPMDERFRKNVGFINVLTKCVVYDPHQSSGGRCR